MNRHVIYLFVLMTFLLAGCNSKTASTSVKMTSSGIDVQNFEAVVRGDSVHLFTLTNENGMEVCITNYGGRIVSLMVPDKSKKMQDVVLGFDSIQDYLTYSTDFGASIGRYANRINKGQFSLNGKTYNLPKNNYGHCLHGGFKGFQTRVFKAFQPNKSELNLSYLSVDKEEGFPGNLKTNVVFKLTADNSLDISYSAVTDAPTVVNMTNHSYFNLNGDAQSNSNLLLQIDADSYTPVDSTFMTSGEILPVEKTPFDFRKLTAVGKRIDDSTSQQLKNGHGYDHNFVLNTKGDISLPCAELYSPQTGIMLTLFTTEPGVQVYSGNFLDGSLIGKNGVKYNCRASVCLETQKYPDSPNKPEWPSATLNPDEVYTSHSIYHFSIK